MTSLSAKAKAFSVDYLLGKDDICKDTEKSVSVPKELTAVENLCSSMGEGPLCCHSAINRLTGS